MFVQTQETPNPNSLKFIPDKKVSNSGSFEITNKDETNNDLVKNILSINGVTGIFLDEDFLSINKTENTNWEDVKHIVISLINEYYSDGKESIIDKKLDSEKQADFNEIEKQIIKILETKIKLKEFKNGVVKVQLQGSCSGCPSSTMTLKQGVQNLLCHYIPDVKEVVAI